jgi:Effector Associated Constant Component 1
VEYRILLVDQGSTDILRGLGNSLLDQEELHGRVEFVEAAPRPGAMGPIVQELQVLADPSHLSTLGAVLVTWLYTRRQKVSIRIKRKGSKSAVDITSSNRSTDAAVRELLEQLTKDLAEHPEAEDGEDEADVES